MGEVKTKVFLENYEDLVLKKSNPKHIVRKAEVDALVDTGAVLCLFPQDLVETLGLEIKEKTIVTLADDSKVELPRASLARITIAGRYWETDCLVGPPQSEALIGQLVLERLDLIVDSLKQKVTPRPESPFLPSLKMK